MPRQQQSPKVSGPGKFSKRTDIPGNGQYGDRKDINEIKSGAPMSQGQPQAQVPSALAGLFNMPQQKVVPLTDPTNYPDQPITDGVPVGPGYSPPPPINNRYAMISKYMDQLDTMAAQEDAPLAFKAFLNFIKTEATRS